MSRRACIARFATRWAIAIERLLLAVATAAFAAAGVIWWWRAST